MYKYAITKKPSKNYSNGLTTVNLGKPDYMKTLIQHSNYVNALKRCEIEVTELESDERFPDSTFIEDTAVVNNKVAIIANPGALSRKGEEIEIKKIIGNFYNNIKSIESPGTLDGGDVLKARNQYYIGLSKRTNKEGAKQLIEILEKYGFICHTITLKNFLHLKSGVNYIGDNNLLITGEFILNPSFNDYNLIEIPKNESYAANCIKVNDYILIPAGYEKTKRSILKLGYNIIELETSEFRKMDGGLSCLSLRF
ncbi:MAG: arginine deiminase-related protein [Promethearchaeota archaeon]